MKPRLWLLALVPAGMLAYLCWQGKPSSAVAGPEKLPGPRIASPYLGAGSCAASACHNSGFTHDTKVGEYTTWITRDPHARAYEVLFHERSKNIQKNLQTTTPAQNEQRCLKCHVAPEYDVNQPPAASYFKTDGVGCESCHGPAKDWINHHHLDAWQFMTAAEKKKLGMTDTQSLLGRAQLCARCHVGEAGMEVDHDLIAAGHPRVNFDLSAFHAQMPRHWPDEKDRAGRPDFDARLWALGQLVTAHAALELLAYRANEKHKKPWPEFAENDCAACHHDLRVKAWRQELGFDKRVPGALPWSNYAALTPRILEGQVPPVGEEVQQLLAKINNSFNSGKPGRQQIADDARRAALLLQAGLAQFEHKKLDPRWVDQLFQTILKTDAPRATKGWDEITRVQLALAALHLARPEASPNLTVRKLQNPIFNSYIKLEIPPGSRYSRMFEPEAIHMRLRQFKDANGKRD